MSFLSRAVLAFFFTLSCLTQLFLTACTFPPRLYRIDIRQGNMIDEEMTCAIRRGMTKSQVQEILGTPALCHTLNSDRWDYYYYFKPGMGGDTVEKRFTIFFKHDRVVNWE